MEGRELQFTAAGLPEALKQGVWAKGMETATRLDKGMSTKAGLQSSHKIFFGGDELLLHCIGEIAVVASRDAIRSKLADRGRICIRRIFESTCERYVLVL